MLQVPVPTSGQYFINVTRPRTTWRPSSPAGTSHRRVSSAPLSSRAQRGLAGAGKIPRCARMTVPERPSTGAALHRSVVAATPLGPGTVVQGNLPVAEQVQRVDERAGAHAGAARGDDGPPGSTPAARMRRRRASGAGAYRPPRPAPCTAGSGFQGCVRPAGRVGAPARCLRTGPRIAYLRSAPLRPEDTSHRGEITDDSRRHRARGEIGSRPRNLPQLQRSTLGTPSGQPPVEHRDALLTEGAKHPPDPGGAEIGPGAVVDDHLVSITDAQASHLLGELAGGGNMWGKGLPRSLMASRSKKTAPGRWPAR